jgi:hypothetical protein
MTLQGATEMDKMGRLLDRAVKDVFTGGLSEQPRHDPATYDVSLSAKQTKAIALLLAGVSITDTAKELSMGRQTLSRWINHHYSFKVAMETERQGIWQRSRDELLSLTGSALQVMRKHLDEGSLAAALGVIKAVGLGDRQLVMAFDAAQTEALERDRERIEHLMFRHAIRERLDAEKAKGASCGGDEEILDLESQGAGGVENANTR